MRPYLLVVMLACVLLGQPARARPDPVFSIGGKERPQRIVVTVGDTLVERPYGSSAMLRQLDGQIAELTGTEVAQFLATPMPKTKLVDARGSLERIGVAHLIGKTGTKRVELLTGNDGVYLAQELDPETKDDRPRVAKLDDDRFRAVSLAWPRFRAPLTDDPAALVKEHERPAPGFMVELAKPYTPGPFFMSKETLGERFLHGKSTTVPATKRVLDEELMYVRLPRGYSAKRPAGLLIWINAGIDGHIPDVFFPALDELGMVGVGIRKVENERPVADRYQLAFDAFATASKRFHIDPRRVYLTGISGGGRISSILAACFPDYFTGAAPIVGLSAYFHTPVGNGRFVPAGYAKPDAKLWTMLRTHRIAPITGQADFNYTEIKQATEQMVQDGLEVRVFETKEMGHQLPTAERFTEALTWVDEPARLLREKEAAAAKALLDKYVERNGKTPPGADKLKQELVKVTEAGPWSPAGWEAAELLGTSKK